MTFEQFSAYIYNVIENRFSIDSKNDIQAEMLALLPENIEYEQVFRFCRQDSTDILGRYMKTVLIVGIELDNLRNALQWAALCKEALLDPETSDIYLFITWIGDNNPSIEECLRIEANEDFCRKLVLRPNETIELFVERTFLKKIDVSEPLDLGQDPLISAFSGFEEYFSWFDQAEKNRWKDAFNSVASGSDLFDVLITHKPENNEAS
jgi:hypothetical protein